MEGGYDSIYLDLIARLSECDLQESANRLGLEYVDSGVHVCFLKREYRITLDGVEPLDGQPVNVNNRSVLLYYLLSKGQGDPENSYLPFESIPRTIGGLHVQRVFPWGMFRCASKGVICQAMQYISFLSDIHVNMD